MKYIVPIIFGWPAVIGSLLVTAAGLVARSWKLVLAGALMAGPFTFYLFGTPGFMIVAPSVFGAYVAAAFVLRRGLLLLAVLLALPFAALAAYVAWLVANQPPV